MTETRGSVLVYVRGEFPVMLRPLPLTIPDGPVHTKITLSDIRPAKFEESSTEHDRETSAPDVIGREELLVMLTDTGLGTIEGMHQKKEETNHDPMQYNIMTFYSQDKVILKGVLVVMMEALMMFDVTVTSQVYRPASEKVNEIKKRVWFVWPDMVTLFLSHW